MSEIIRINPDEIFNTDSRDYHILEHAAKCIKNTEGAVVEIGTRQGGSARIIIDALKENEDTDRSMFCIDPYGNIELAVTNINLSLHYPDQNFGIEGDPLSLTEGKHVRFDYTNDMRNQTVPALYAYAFSKGINFQFFFLEDTEFFKLYKKGVPVYNEYKSIVNKYAFVFFDGPHTNEAVQTELDFFLPRCGEGAVFVFDDIWMYDHNKFETLLFENGFLSLQKSLIKASYIKKK